jgi:hypothetical protein
VLVAHVLVVGVLVVGMLVLVDVPRAVGVLVLVLVERLGTVSVVFLGTHIGHVASQRGREIIPAASEGTSMRRAPIRDGAGTVLSTNQR